MKLRAGMLALLFAIASPLQAGSSCAPSLLSPTQIAAAAKVALKAVQALDEADADVALIARVGTDLERYGLHYSHVGFAVRDHPDGRWSVVHLLNECGSSRSSLYSEGLLNFFADDLIQLDMRIVWVDPVLAKRLAQLLQSDALFAWHQPNYSVIARPDSARYQNSTAFVLDLLAAAEDDSIVDRAGSQRAEREHGFDADVIDIAYSKRIVGGLFSANIAFTDHPLATRLSGHYPVVTVRSIQRYLNARRWIVAEREWRDGVETSPPGPM